MTGERTEPDARRAFLGSLIDDAALFPPASLSMPAAVSGHRRARAGPHPWMLGRFLSPASRLGQLAAELTDAAEEPPWDVGVVADRAAGERWIEGLRDDVEAIGRFAVTAGGRATVRLVEIRIPPGGDPERDVRTIMRAMQPLRVPAPVTPFLEVPMTPGWRREVPTAVAAIAAAGDGDLPRPGVLTPPGAKIRCGGQSTAVPDPEQVALFVSACRAAEVPVKATAGLHHPYRRIDRQTGLTQHGFVNVVGAAVLAHAGPADEETLAKLVADEDPDHFELGVDGFGWLDLWADAEAVAEARRDLFIAFGSCSFDEPVEDLQASGVLPLER